MGILEFLAKSLAKFWAKFLAVLAVSAEFLAVLAAGFLAVLLTAPLPTFATTFILQANIQNLHAFLSRF